MRYNLMAVMLGPIWLLVLLWVPGPELGTSMTLGAVLDSGMTEACSLPVWFIYLLFPVLSFLLARLFKSWLIRCEGKARILPSLVLPFVAVLIFAFICILSGLLHWRPLDWEMVDASIIITLLLGLLYLLAYSWVIVPLGIFSHACLLGAYGRDQRRANLQ